MIEEELTPVVEGACDFLRSYLSWDIPYRPDPRPYARHDTPLGNMVRILLESLLDVVDDRSGRTTRYVLIAACRTEWVYAEDHLLQVPSSEYRLIFSTDYAKSVGSGMILGTPDLPGQPSRGQALGGTYRSVNIDVRRHANTRVLETTQDIIRATQAGWPLVARTELQHPDAPIRYVLEYPIKTMNYQPEQVAFQVDTGPLAVPDFRSTEPLEIDRFVRAHVAFNHKHLDRAEFLIYRPNPIKEGDREICQVMHYSELVPYPAKTTMLAAEDE